MVGFPGSLAAMWQRAGRCGRSASDALCIVIAYPSPIDQWAMRHPARLLAMGVEDVIVDTANPIVLRQHLLCEQPLTADADADVFGVREVRGVLREELPEELTEARTAGAEGHVGPTGGAATRNLDAGGAGGAEGRRPTRGGSSARAWRSCCARGSWCRCRPRGALRPRGGVTCWWRSPRRWSTSARSIRAACR